MTETTTPSFRDRQRQSDQGRGLELTVTRCTIEEEGIKREQLTIESKNALTLRVTRDPFSKENPIYEGQIAGTKGWRTLFLPEIPVAKSLVQEVDKELQKQSQQPSR